MRKISLGKYAKEHKLSRAQVIKLILQNRLKSEEIYENGKKKTYIILDDEKIDENKNIKKFEDIGIFFEKKYENLLKDIKIDSIYKDDEEYFILSEERVFKIYKENKIYKIKELKKIK